MKIAFITEDEQTLSPHFGRAPKVVVVTVEEGQEVAREVRARASGGAHHDQDHEHGHHHHGQHNPAEKFTAMADCEVLVVRGIGGPAVAYAGSMGMQVFLTRQVTIDDALAAYLAGELDHHPGDIHYH